MGERERDILFSIGVMKEKSVYYSLLTHTDTYSIYEHCYKVIDSGFHGK